MNTFLIRRFLPSLLALILFAPLRASEDIEEFLKKLPLQNVKILEKEAFYSHIYEVMFDQPLDHNHPEAGSFSQRLYISHIDVASPVVFVTEGYSASYYYTSEPAALLRCNQIIAEHRYFGKSVPDSIQWEYLNTWQAASDHHRIFELFKEFYTNKWITTGISKGGQTVMFHSYYYPEDVDVRIPYVAPLNMSVEDTRIYDFLDHVGSRDCRKKIHKFQKYMLKNQEFMLPAFKEFTESKDYTFELVGGIESAFEYCVLEYSFAFWQWGYSPCSAIPGKKSSPEELIRHMNKVAGFDYFADEFVKEYRPFFYQALTEMGYYGYDLDEFSAYIKHVREPGFEFSLPKNIDVVFNDQVLRNVDSYIKTEAENFIFIYGEYDTWSATAVDPADNSNIEVFFKEKGSHRTRLRNMPLEQQKEILSLLESYLAD